MAKVDGDELKERYEAQATCEPVTGGISCAFHATRN